ncbi:MAG: ABC transporter permease, partial [Planctomycetota bacterium]
LRAIVWREMFERKSQLTTSFVAIVLGIAVVVSIRNITFYSEQAVARELDTLGANVLVLPQSATVQDYYSADLQSAEMPEEYATRLSLSNLEGLENLSPKLSTAIEIVGQRVTLTGILPKSEFRAKASWGGAAGFGLKHEGCKHGTNVPDAFKDGQNADVALTHRYIEDLAPDEVLIGSDVAERLDRKEGQLLGVKGRPFQVIAVLPETGTVDDSRVFAHLHTVQELLEKDAVVNAIEVVGCCDEIANGLVAGIGELLPETKVVTISQVVDTQVRTNQLMSRLSLIFIGIIALAGIVGIANYMYSNVFERRREIGTMMALGATSGTIVRMFLLKALLLGAAGGFGGYLLGTGIAITLGPRIAGIPVLPMPWLFVFAVSLAVGVALLASCLPARSAARLDPSATIQEL